VIPANAPNQDIPMRPLISAQMFRRFLHSEDGATSIEYALIASGISIAILGAVTTLGGNVNATWTRVSTALR
jgi:pilus assembly protein Flp/PilA